MRVFFAIEPDEESRQRLEALIHAARPHLADCGRITPVRDLHLTLLFVGDWPDGSIDVLDTLLKDVASSIPPFSIRFTRFGAFHHRRGDAAGRSEPAILWIGGSTSESGKPSENPDDQALNRLVHQLRRDARQIGIKTDDRPFTPHLTLTRKMPGNQAQDILRSLPDFAPILFKVRAITLMQSIPDSGHRRYEPLRRADLREVPHGTDSL